MATVLITWELGGGMGHVTRLRPIARALCSAGHRVVFASRDLIAARRAFAESDVACLQAPVQRRKSKSVIPNVRSYAQLLSNVGFASHEELGAAFEGWRSLFDLVDPEVTLFDHSPTALLASRSSATKRILFGDGFCCPPVDGRLPDLRPRQGGPAASCLADEQHVRDVANSILRQNGCDEVEQLSDIYGDVDETLLGTFEELDHFGPRSGAHYWGTWPSYPGDRPQWPQGSGKRVFAYLKPFPALASLLGELRRLALPTIIVGSWVDEAVRRRFGSNTLTLTHRPVDLVAAGSESDLAILNGTHGTTAALLLSGTPCLQIPIYQEQRLVGERTAAMGAGVIADRTNLRDVVKQLHRLLGDDQPRQAASRFASRYRDVDPQEQLDLMVGRIESHLAAALASTSATETAALAM